MGNTKNFIYVDNKLKGAGVLNWVTDSSYVYDINFGKSQAEVNSDYQIFKNNFIKQSFSFTPSILEKNISNTITFNLFNYLVNEENIQTIESTPVITLTYNENTLTKNMVLSNKKYNYSLTDNITTDLTYSISINNIVQQSGTIKTYKRIYYGSYLTVPNSNNYTNILYNKLSSGYSGPYDFSKTLDTVNDTVYFWLLIPSEISLTATSLQAIQGGMPRWTFNKYTDTEISGYTIYKSTQDNIKKEITSYDTITVTI